MIFCIPASESRGIDSAFEAVFEHAVSMVVFNSETQEAWDVPADPANGGTGIPLHFNTVLCSSIRRDVWSHHLQQRIRFFGVEAKTVREAIDKYRKGDITAVQVLSNGVEQAEAGTLAMAGCGCVLHKHGHRVLHHARNGEGQGHRHEANRECGSGKDHEHGHGACSGHGKQHGGGG